ncbi:MAG: suppressor of fused domain protein [Armatimonadetes bacterium]|nr:suppressor of fused domain protein [Armatimonadota bacterium]
MANRTAIRSRIVRHTTSVAAHSPAIVEHSLIRDVSTHVKRYLGPVGWVYHEEDSLYVHVDVHVVPPRAGRPHYTLITSGMSAAPMRVPCEDHETLIYAELVMCLPADWPLTGRCGARMTPGSATWPIQWLRDLARLPHQYDTFLDIGHSIPNGEPAQPIGHTDFTGVVLLPPISTPEPFWTLERGNRTIRFLGVWPLLPEEMKYKLDHGTDRLWARFVKHGVTDVLNLNRVHVAPKARR